MRLNSNQIQQAIDQLSVQVLPDDHPAISQLSNVFGDHTFFLNERGLSVLEPLEPSEMQAQTGELISLADWSDQTLTKLSAHEPEPTGMLISFRKFQE